jgi:hypothetical protein
MTVQTRVLGTPGRAGAASARSRPRTRRPATGSPDAVVKPMIPPFARAGAASIFGRAPRLPGRIAADEGRAPPAASSVAAALRWGGGRAARSPRAASARRQAARSARHSQLSAATPSGSAPGGCTRRATRRRAAAGALQRARTLYLTGTRLAGRGMRSRRSRSVGEAVVRGRAPSSSQPRTGRVGAAVAVAGSTRGGQGHARPSAGVRARLASRDDGRTPGPAGRDGAGFARSRHRCGVRAGQGHGRRTGQHRRQLAASPHVAHERAQAAGGGGGGDTWGGRGGGGGGG